MRRKSRGYDDKSALDILEEATHLLRGQPLLLAPYYFGSLPFILGLLYFWTDMSVGANAWRHCPQAAWGLTLLFIWMKTWQSIYASRLLARIRNEVPPRWGLSRVLRTAGVQTAIQPWSIIILPVAFFLMVPFPQAFAFFQNATVMGNGDDWEMRATIRKSWRQALLWAKQNILIIWLTSPFLLVFAAFFVFVFVPVSSSFNPGAPVAVLLIIAALVVIPLCPLGMITALNIGVAVFLLPWLLKTLFDVETIFSMSSAHIMNNTFFAVVCSLSYLCLDPLMKASYCLRCFYGESLHTGEDLKVELRLSRKPTGLVILLLTFVLTLGASSSVLAESRGAGVPAHELDSAIESVIQYPEYTWRMPREKTPDIQGSQSAFHEFLNSITKPLRKGWDYIKKGLTKVWNYIKDILSRIRPILPRMEKPGAGWTSFSKILIIIPLVCMVAVLAFLAWRAWKNRTPRAINADVSVQPAPDITREDLDAAALPEEGWLNLAGELMEKGELRLALRALYLSTLAFLARQELITIAKYKSDREYELELRRRSHTRPDLAGVFGENRSLFENAWYGLHEVTPGIVDRFSRNQESIRVHAQS
jgi:hypothetical protein